jgi:hypothetical protein
VGPRPAIALYRQNFCATEGYGAGSIGHSTHGAATRRSHSRPYNAQIWLRCVITSITSGMHHTDALHRLPV